jgi:hypothetical protein
LLEDSIEGIIRSYTPNTKLLGAENRQGVTCYLDALLFAMFARLDCFEAILYKSFNDEPRRKLAILLRLWVNLLRAGKLITTDIVRTLFSVLFHRAQKLTILYRQSTYKMLSQSVAGKMQPNFNSKMPQKLSRSLLRSWSYHFLPSKWTSTTLARKMPVMTINSSTNDFLRWLFHPSLLTAKPSRSKIVWRPTSTTVLK